MFMNNPSFFTSVTDAVLVLVLLVTVHTVCLGLTSSSLRGLSDSVWVQAEQDIAGACSCINTIL